MASYVQDGEMVVGLETDDGETVKVEVDYNEKTLKVFKGRNGSTFDLNQFEPFEDDHGGW